MKDNFEKEKKERNREKRKKARKTEREINNEGLYVEDTMGRSFLVL